MEKVTLSEKEKGDLTSYLDFPFRDVLCEAILLELSDLKEEELTRVLVFMETLTSSGAYMFFSKENILMITESVANHIGVRRFALGISERAEMLMRVLSDDTFDKSWFVAVTESITVSRSAFTNKLDSLLPDEVCEHLKIEEEELVRVMQGNRWLVVIYLTIITGAWNAALADYITDNK